MLQIGGRLDPDERAVLAQPRPKPARVNIRQSSGQPCQLTLNQRFSPLEGWLGSHGDVVGLGPVRNSEARKALVFGMIGGGRNPPEWPTTDLAELNQVQCPEEERQARRTPPDQQDGIQGDVPAWKKARASPFCSPHSETFGINMLPLPKI